MDRPFSSIQRIHPIHLLLKTNTILSSPLLITQSMFLYTTIFPYKRFKANKFCISVTLWDPYGEGINAYKYIDISTLKTSSKWIYHLDWPHFLWPMIVKALITELIRDSKESNNVRRCLCHPYWPRK